MHHCGFAWWRLPVSSCCAVFDGDVFVTGHEEQSVYKTRAWCSIQGGLLDNVSVLFNRATIPLGSRRSDFVWLLSPWLCWQQSISSQRYTAGPKTSHPHLCTDFEFWNGAKIPVWCKQYQPHHMWPEIKDKYSIQPFYSTPLNSYVVL